MGQKLGARTFRRDPIRDPSRQGTENFSEQELIAVGEIQDEREDLFIRVLEYEHEVGPDRNLASQIADEGQAIVQELYAVGVL